jgi:hypothetical protein
VIQSFWKIQPKSPEIPARQKNNETAPPCGSDEMPPDIMRKISGKAKSKPKIRITIRGCFIAFITILQALPRFSIKIIAKTIEFIKRHAIPIPSRKVVKAGVGEVTADR